MADTVTFKGLKLDYEGIGKILRSPEIQAVCDKEAKKRCGSEQHIKSFTGFDRVHSIVYPNTKEYPR